MQLADAPAGLGCEMYRFGSHGIQSALRVTASLDAAMALCERVLPGSSWEVGRLLHNNRGFANLYVVGDAQDDPVQHYSGDAKTPPLALLTAILRALVAQDAQV
jgi:hypothetical protein